MTVAVAVGETTAFTASVITVQARALLSTALETLANPNLEPYALLELLGLIQDATGDLYLGLVAEMPRCENWSPGHESPLSLEEMHRMGLLPQMVENAADNG